MLSFVVLALVGLSFTVARPAPTVTTTATVPAPTKYAACKANDCPPFRVVKKIAPNIELREYHLAWWANAKTQAPIINRKVTTPLYWRLRSYLKNDQIRYLRMGVPVTKLIEQTPSGNKTVTMSFYLSIPNPPRPSRITKVWLESKSLQVYVKIFKGKSFYTLIKEGHANNLATALIAHGFDGTFYPPTVKYMSAGYDSPFVPRQDRTNEVWLIKKPRGIK